MITPKPFKAFAALTLMMAALSCTNAVQRFMPESDLVFRGTTLVLNASTIDVEDVSSLAIVRVEEVLTGSEAFGDLAGTQITMRLREPGRMRVGQEHVYFARSWHLGESLGVVELGSVVAPGARGLDNIRSEIGRVQQQQSDEELLELLQAAELVVVGRVTESRPGDFPAMATEHDPNWHEADVVIERVLKGEYEDPRLTILYPRSDDVSWFQSPRFNEGVEGIWLLQSFDFLGRRLEHLTALQPGQFRQRDEEERIVRLLRDL